MHAIVFSTPRLREIGVSALGCACIALGAYIKIPFYPVSVTLQTFALLLIALTQSPRQAFCSASSYLVLATLGFPVFAWHTNPYWWMGKCAGYLYAFPLSAYWIAKMKGEIGYFLAAVSGAAFILFTGALWLIPFVGLQLAFTKGFVCFIPCELAKILVVSVLVKRGDS